MGVLAQICLKSRVADPYLLFTDPDPVFPNILDPDLGFQNAIFSRQKLQIIISSNNKM
jgi:hypothetical protein